MTHLFFTIMDFETVLTVGIVFVSMFIVPCVAIVFVLVKLFSSNRKVEMELARQGIIPPVRSKPAPNKYRSLRNGILSIGTAIGVITGCFCAANYSSVLAGVNSDHTDGLFYGFPLFCASILVFMGLSYLVFYFIVKDKNLESDEN